MHSDVVNTRQTTRSRSREQSSRHGNRGQTQTTDKNEKDSPVGETRKKKRRRKKCAREPRNAEANKFKQDHQCKYVEKAYGHTCAKEWREIVKRRLHKRQRPAPLSVHTPARFPAPPRTHSTLAARSEARAQTRVCAAAVWWPWSPSMVLNSPNADACK